MAYGIGRAIDSRTDLYSFGVLAYHTLTGELPFSGYALELALHHLNDTPELPSNRQAHATLEPSYGVTDSWELGAYLQGTLLPGGTFEYSGVKLRSKLVTPPGWHEHLRLGVNFELSRLPVAYDPARWGVEVRPIVAWEDDRFLFALNPNLGMPLTAPASRQGPELEPCAMTIRSPPSTSSTARSRSWTRTSPSPISSA